MEFKSNLSNSVSKMASCLKQESCTSCVNRRFEGMAAEQKPVWDGVLSIRGSGNIPRLVGQVLELVAETVCAVYPSGLRCPGLLSLLLTHSEKRQEVFT